MHRWAARLGSAIPPPPRLRSAGPVRSPPSSGSGRGGWKPSSAWARPSRSTRNGRQESVSARDLALDSGLLMQAGGAEVILAEQAYVAQGPRALKAPAQRVLDLREQPCSLPYLLGLGDLLLAQSSAVPGRERQMAAALASVEARGGIAPDTLAQIWAVRALPRLLEPRLCPVRCCCWTGSPITLWWTMRRRPRCINLGCGCWSARFVGENDAEARTALRPSAGRSAPRQSGSPALCRGDCRGPSRPS